ncbi:MAG TPA: tol-pal system protein YbgF [Casimicrobiaceae bacterium]|nr:tol-pal system protein YbgF [Casimicrobiaceae bacterium]
MRGAAGRGRLRGAALAVALVLALGAGATRAALFDDDEARKRIADTNLRLTQVQKQLEDRIAALEQQLKAQGLVEMLGAVEQIKADIARLRGQVEVLGFELAEAQKRQRDLYVDLDSRLRKLETAPPPAAAPAPTATPPLGTVPGPPGGPIAGTPAPGAATIAVPVPPGATATGTGDAAAEQREYDAALEQFKRADYPGAIASFGAFVRNRAKSPLAPSAQYWIGNAHYARRDFRAAIAAQRLLVQVYPDSTKVPDAMLNISSAQSELNDNAAARRTLEELIAKYPTSEAAGKARQRLGVR